MPREAEEPTIAQVQRLLAEQVPSLAGQHVRALRTPGTTNRIYRIGSQHVARFPQASGHPDTTAAALRQELCAIDEFRHSTTVPSPRPVHLGRPGHGYTSHWAVLTWTPGTPANPHGQAANTALAHDLARLIEELRSADTAGRTFTGAGRGGRLSDHDEWVEHCIAQSCGLLDTQALTTAWARMRELAKNEPDVMSHTDLIPANIVVTNGRLAGILDTGGYQAADPALDLVCAWHLFDEPARTSIRRSLACDDEQWVRGRAWAFQQAVGLVWYYHDTNPHMADLGRSTLTRVLTD